MDVRNISMQVVAAMNTPIAPIAGAFVSQESEEKKPSPKYKIDYTTATLPSIDESKIKAALFLDWDGTIIKLRVLDADPICFINQDKIKKLFLDAMSNHVAIHIVTAMQKVPDFILSHLSKLGIINQKNENIWRSRLHFVLSDEEFALATSGQFSQEQIAKNKYTAIKTLLETKYNKLTRAQLRFADDWPCNCQSVNELMPYLLSNGDDVHIDELLSYIATDHQNVPPVSQPMYAGIAVDSSVYDLADWATDFPQDSVTIMPTAQPSEAFISNSLFTLFSKDAALAEDEEKNDFKPTDHSSYLLAKSICEYLDLIFSMFEKLQFLDSVILKPLKEKLIFWPLKSFPSLLNLFTELREVAEIQKELPPKSFFRESKTENPEQNQIRAEQHLQLKNLLHIVCDLKFNLEERPDVLQTLAGVKDRLVKLEKSLQKTKTPATEALDCKMKLR